MSDDDEKHSGAAVRNGYGFLALLAAGLTILFVALKLTGYIDWAWWQVLLPAIIYVICSLPCCIIIAVILAAIGGVAFTKVLKDALNK